MNKSYLKRKRLLIFILIYFVFLTLYLSLITLSRYVYTTNESSSKSIAKWEVYLSTSDNPSDSISIVSGNTEQTYILKITSLSDVAANYSIYLSNIPTGVNVALDNGTPASPTNGEITFSNVGTINADATVANRTIEHTITFSSIIGTSTITNANVYIDVIINQVQI